MRLLLIILTTSFVSCSTTRKVTFITGDKQGNRIAYSLRVPKAFKTISFGDQHYTGTSFIYSDSSLIFLTNDLTKGIIYEEKEKKYGSNIRLQFVANDTLTIRGTDKNGRFWEERKIGNVVYGYLNVPEAKKAMYDQILNTINLSGK